MITLKTLPNATAQEVFDRVATHLLTQMKKSTDHSGYCTYRGQNGLKCAAGCLIGDDEYNKDFEGKAWQCLVDEYEFPSKFMELISSLQCVHDEFLPPEWGRTLRRVAKKYFLSDKIVDETLQQ